MLVDVGRCSVTTSSSNCVSKLHMETKRRAFALGFIETNHYGWILQRLNSVMFHAPWRYEGCTVPRWPPKETTVSKKFSIKLEFCLTQAVLRSTWCGRVLFALLMGYSCIDALKSNYERVSTLQFFFTKCIASNFVLCFSPHYFHLFNPRLFTF